MKNNKFLLILSIFGTLMGCSSNNNSSDEQDYNLKIISPTSAPALAFIDHLNNENYHTNTKPNNIVLEMMKETYDIVVVDLIGGLTAIQMKNAPYKLASVITFGNFYVYGTGNDNDNIIDNDDNIIGFGQNTTPDILFKHLYPDINIDTYLEGVSDVLPIAAEGTINNNKVDYCIIAEPALYNVLNNLDANTYGKGYIHSSFQDKWKNLHGNDTSILGASIYVKNTSYEKYKLQIDEFLNNTSNNINKYLNNPDLIVEKLNQYGNVQEQGKRIGINSKIASGVMKDNSINLGYLSSKNKDFNKLVEEYLNIVKPEIINKNNYL